MTTRNDRRHGYVVSVLLVAALGALYFVVASFSLKLGAVGGAAAPVWPPSGIALAAMLLFGRRVWPGIAAGAFLVNWWVVGAPAPAAVGMSLGNTLEALLGSYLLRRGIFRTSLERLHDVLRLIVLAAGVSTLMSAMIGATSAWLGNVLQSPDYPTAFWTWWFGDGMGDLVVAPALLVWSKPPRLRRPMLRWIEGAGLVIALFVVATVAFRMGIRVRGDQYLGAYAVFPFVIWAALRFGQRGATVATVVVSALAVWSTVSGFGPFARASVHESLLFVQTFTVIIGATALVLGAVITERRRAEAALRESEERDRRLIEISPDVVLLIDLDGTISLSNERAAEVLGYTRGELTERNAIGLFAAKDRLRAVEHLRRTLESGSVRNVEYTLLKGDGSPLPFELSVSVLRHRTGKPQGYIAVGRDISERKKSETEALRMTAIVESSSDAIIGKTLDGTVTNWNAAAEQVYGYSAAEMIGQPIARLAPPESVAEIDDILATIKGGKRIRDFETLRVRKDGTRIHVSVSISPIHDAAGDIVGASTIARDISGRKALEQLRADFITSLTHDIRGPVGNIGGYLEVLREEPGLSAEAQEVIAVMEASVRTTFSLITNYLDRTRIEAGRFSLTKGPVVLSELLGQVARQYEVVGARRNISVFLHLPAKLPPVDGDALALERVFANLVHNAYKFTPPGGSITISTWQEGQSVGVSVADTGPGIPAEDIPLVFERFHQTASGRLQLGAGLGLFIAKSLVDAHGGRIQVASDGGGSCFTVTLPCWRAEASPAVATGTSS